MKQLVIQDGRVEPNSELQAECQAWAIDISLLTVDEALKYLDRMLIAHRSNGEYCLYAAWDNGYDERPYGKCMCARLLGMMHEVDERSMNTAVFTKLQELRTSAG